MYMPQTMKDHHDSVPSTLRGTRTEAVDVSDLQNVTILLPDESPPRKSSHVEDSPMLGTDVEHVETFSVVIDDVSNSDSTELANVDPSNRVEAGHDVDQTSASCQTPTALSYALLFDSPAKQEDTVKRSIKTSSSSEESTIAGHDRRSNGKIKKSETEPEFLSCINNDIPEMRSRIGTFVRKRTSASVLPLENQKDKSSTLKPSLSMFRLKTKSFTRSRSVGKSSKGEILEASTIDEERENDKARALSSSNVSIITDLSGAECSDSPGRFSMRKSFSQTAKQIRSTPNSPASKLKSMRSFRLKGGRGVRSSSSQSSVDLETMPGAFFNSAVECVDSEESASVTPEPEDPLSSSSSNPPSPSPQVEMACSVPSISSTGTSCPSTPASLAPFDTVGTWRKVYHSAKRKTFRKADTEQKVSPFASLPATIPSQESTEGSKRFRVCQEIYASEYSYVRNLEVLVEVFKAALKPILSNKDLDSVFVNVESIYEFNCELLTELHKLFSAFTEETTVGDIFTSKAARFNVYSVFCANHRAAEETVARLKRKSDVQDALAAAGQDARVAGGLNLQSFLLTPVQRMPRYLLLLQNLLRNTTDSHPDFKLLREAVGKLNTITEHVNQQIRERENQIALSGLRNQVIGLDAHDLPGRKLVKEGQVCLTSIRKLYQCILFNDLMVFALRGDNKGKVEIALDLSTVWVHDLGNNDPQTTSDDAIEIFTPDRPYTIYVKSVNEKRLWLNEIRSAIFSHLKEHSNDMEPPSDLEERTGIAAEGQPQAAIVRASDVVHRCAQFKYANGLCYDGCWLDGMRHGKGEMTWCDNTTYDGDWVENERVGDGKLTYKTAETYSGTWVNDVQTGRGTLTFCSGDSYVGDWRGALPQGVGKVEYNNGDIFSGTFDQGTITGDGTLKCKNGISYDGQWLESQFDGEGRHVNRYGDQFAGELVHNCYHGSGIMRYKDGAKYDGIWEKGHRHGYGSYKDPKGIEYNGNWRLDQRHGQGWQKYPDGSVYDGEWEYNSRHGAGKMRYANGDEYSGMFKHDHAHGRGTMTYSDCAVYIGDFKFGQRHGYGVMEYANGGHYDGSWVHNFREGEGTYTFEDDSYTGEFAHDRPHGKGMYSHKGSSTTYTGQFMAGKRCGHGTESSPMGKFVGEWKYGMRHGLGKETSSVGTVFDGSWHCNQRTGVFTVRSVTGEVSEVQYQSGMLVTSANAHDVPNMPILPRTMM